MYHRGLLGHHVGVCSDCLQAVEQGHTAAGSGAGARRARPGFGLAPGGGASMGGGSSSARGVTGVSAHNPPGPAKFALDGTSKYLENVIYGFMYKKPVPGDPEKSLLLQSGECTGSCGGRR
jgi:hypothetical protein